jgi:hypothetical protein
VWHIQENIIHHLSEDAVKKDFRSLIYDRSFIQEHESKLVDLFKKNKVTSKESWLHQMTCSFQMKHLYFVAR